MKDKQPLVVLAAALGTVLLAGVFCYTQLEIVPSTRWESPSREVQANPYYALEKWLNATGRPARHLSMGNIKTLTSAPEQTIFIENSRFSWDDDPKTLLPWIRSGGRIIISLDSYINFRLEDFMRFLGVYASSFHDYDDLETAAETIPGKETDNRAEITGNDAAKQTADAQKKEAAPLFDWNVSFKIAAAGTETDRVLVMRDEDQIKIVKLEMGKGSLVFTGHPLFLYHYNLAGKPDRDLAAELFFSEDKSGVLFIRGLAGDSRVLGNLAEHGNPAALLVSLVLLIIAGFWSVIPVFGRYKASPEKPGKPLRERFLAEGRFLKKNHALGKYIETYKKELEQKSRRRGIISGAPETAAETSVPDSTSPRIKSITFAQFIKEQKALTEQLSCLQTLKFCDSLNKGRRYELHHRPGAHGAGKR